ncbi:MFS general substrate transporter [Melanogaster broomeanus]|nr:MFS general substrate transporter [Melanogaster broomeanus]
MTDVEKQSLPAQESGFEGTPSEVSSRNNECTDSRLKAWMAVFGTFLALFCSFGQLNAFGTFQLWYSGHQLVSMPLFSISWIGSLQLWTFFFMGGPIGCIFDTYGPTPILISGSIILVSSIMLTGIAVEYYQYLLAQGILFGLGVAMLFYPSIACVATHFNKYRATAIGIATAGSGFGGVIYPIMLRHLFETVGFEMTTRISALIAGILGITAILTVRPRLPSKKKANFSLGIQTIKDRQFLLLVAGSSFVCLGIFTPYFYISDYAESVVGRIAPAWLSDKIGRFNLLCPSGIAIFATIYGLFSGAFISVVTPCVAQISDLREIGARIRSFIHSYFRPSSLSLFGGPIAGVLLQDQLGSFTASIAIAGSSMILGSVLLLASKLTVDRRFLCHV